MSLSAHQNQWLFVRVCAWISVCPLTRLQMHRLHTRTSQPESWVQRHSTYEYLRKKPVAISGTIGRATHVL